MGAFLAGAMTPFVSGGLDIRLFASSIIIGLGTVLAALSGAWLINRYSNGRSTFETPRGIVQFALIVFVPVALIASLAAVGGLFLANEISVAGPFKWITWWLADAAGTLITAPAVVLWATTPLRPFSRWTLAETAATFALAAIIGALAFSPAIGSLSVRIGPISKPVRLSDPDFAVMDGVARRAKKRRNRYADFLRYGGLGIVGK